MVTGFGMYLGACTGVLQAPKGSSRVTDWFAAPEYRLCVLPMLSRGRRPYAVHGAPSCYVAFEGRVGFAVSHAYVRAHAESGWLTMQEYEIELHVAEAAEARADEAAGDAEPMAEG